MVFFLYIRLLLYIEPMYRPDKGGAISSPCHIGPYYISSPILIHTSYAKSSHRINVWMSVMRSAFSLLEDNDVDVSQDRGQGTGDGTEQDRRGQYMTGDRT